MAWTRFSLKKREAETQIDYQNIIFIGCNCYYQLANMTSKRKVKSTSHIQQTPMKTKQLSTKNSIPTPFSLIYSSAATNKQTVSQLKPLWKSSKKASIIYQKKLTFGGKDLWTWKPDHVAQTVNSLFQTKIDNQEQYLRQPCLVINGLGEPGDEDEIQKIAATIEEETGTSWNTVINIRGDRGQNSGGSQLVAALEWPVAAWISCCN